MQCPAEVADQDGDDKDQDETMDMDNNIIPGCYILDISIPLAMTNMPNLWLEYQVVCSQDNQALVSPPILFHQHSDQVCAVRQECLDLLHHLLLHS